MTSHKKTIALKGNIFNGEYIKGGLQEYYSLWRVSYNKDKKGYCEIKKAIAVGWNYSKNDIPPKFFKNYEEIFNY
jgi:hypothetical protein